MASFPGGTSGNNNNNKNLPAKAGDIRGMGQILKLRKSLGGEHSNPLQYSCLENPMDRGAWRATVYRVAKSQTRLKWLITQAKETKYVRLRNLGLFFVWEDAWVWAQWNHYLDGHVSYLGPVCWAFLSWVPTRLTFGGGCEVMSGWLQHPLFTDVAAAFFYGNLCEGLELDNI